MSEPRAAAGEPVALALGAGGARGLAQIGVIEAVQARGFHIVAVAGSSIGALVGGLFAAGKLEAYRDWLLSKSRADILRMLDPAFGTPALFRGERLMQALRLLAGSPRIEALPIDYTAVAVDLMRQREVWLRDGDLWDAVRASIAIPGVFTPYTLRGRELVDGGILAPLPITATRLSGAHRLIAVDMHGWPAGPPGRLARPSPAELPRAAAALPASLLTRWLRRFGGEAAAVDMAGSARAIGFSELMARSLDTMQAQIARVQLALDPPEILIRIPRDACQFYEFWRARELIELGRAQAEKALDAAGY
ncbi:patatin-like phospholipase family protein [Vulcaniibacterium thermophilum]|uniref:NTE family protein n=1 Tax=Vulcaniibacterium thermophilum TaxID=1169913 RepID=A0A918Z8C6_9GAMM|nr:patatin-like phospholipase family protein [Vulcaniibacterium thermophilum]GHE39992.1 putative NTE family protein [Vulcaniibacterium thermophilum]